MKRFLIVWEDHYYQTIGPFVRKRLSALAPAGQTTYPELLFHTSHGTGGFKRYASSTWDNIRSKGLPNNPGPIDHLICVVDGDKLHEQLEGVKSPPSSEPDLATWLTNSERAWESHLRSLCTSAPPTTISGVVLRWAKESLVLAGYDREAIRLHLGVDTTSAAIKEYLARCSPVPSTIAGASFSASFRKPLRCLTELDAAGRAPRPPALSKNAVEFDDALRALAQNDATIVAERVPDLDRIATLVWQLAATELTPTPPAPKMRPPAQKPAKRARK